ncbi:MAG: arabinogalactan endo-1,4-beta-galactosidase [Firmicutes bacterium]|nr:arabinogalactan endo-1,4-beta-galactosidase [Bacillota bacterium]
MDFITGFDLSTLEEVERCGGKFYDGGAADSALNILRRHGGNYLRLRLWNDPFTPEGADYGAGVCDLSTVLRLARRAKNVGMVWLLDLHYSDFWADPGKQTVPKAWQGLDADGLAQAVYRYTLDVLCACRAAGVVPQMVQVGNELTNGLLWPYGRMPDYDNVARFVRAGVRAVREFDPEIPVMVHLDNGGNNGLYRDWFDHFFARGGECDVIGLSYYPLWHGTMAALEENLRDLAARYGKPLILAETSTCFTLADYGAYEQLPPERRKGAPMRPELVEKLPYPPTPQGQADFLEALLDILRRVPGGLGKGFFWWEAAWLPVPGSGWAKQGGWEYVHERGPGGNEWANQALFDFDGNALPALKMLSEYGKTH